MFDKNSVLRLIYTVLISVFITLIVLAVFYDYAGVVIIILKGIIAGVLIWFMGEVLFPLCEKIYPRSIIPSYIVLILIISIGTAIFGYLLGVKSVSILVKMCITAELFGIGVTVIYRRKYIKDLNSKLEKNQEKS